MTTLLKRMIFLIVILVFISAQPLGFVQAEPLAQASNGGLLVNGAILELNATPGQVFIHKMQVGSGSGAPPMDIQVDAAGFGQGLEGDFRPLPAEQDASPYSALPFITGISNPAFHLNPGDTVDVDVTVSIPNDVGKDSRYAIIYIHSQPIAFDTQNAMGQILAVSVPVIITPQGAELNKVGSITSLEIAPVQVGQPIQIATTVVNNGNRHFRVKGTATITDAAGQLVTELPIPQTSTSIFPTLSRKLVVSYSALDRPGGLLPGDYNVTVRIVRDDETPVDEATGTFKVSKPYVPFQDIPQGNITIIRFNGEEPGELILPDIFGLAIRLENTGVITGSLAVGKYDQAPATKPVFGDDAGNGGTGEAGVKYWALRTEGFTQGNAQLIARYAPGELGETGSPNGLFLAYHDGDVWRKLNNLELQTGTQSVLGGLPVTELEKGAQIGLGLAGAEAAVEPTVAIIMPKNTGPTADTDQNNQNLLLYGGAVILALVVGLSVGLITSRGRRAAPKSQK